MRNNFLKSALVVGLFALAAMPAETFAGVTKAYINISGTATGAGTVTVQLKEQGGDVIGSYSWTAAAGDDFEDAAKGLRNSGNIPGYTDNTSNNKTEGGVRKSVFYVKTKRGGVAFTANITENIPGISVDDPKDSANALRLVSMSQDELAPGFDGPFDLFGKGTTWMTDDITDVDLGEGISVSDVQILSDFEITLHATVAESSPLGPEYVDVIGNSFWDDGEPMLDMVLDTSMDPLFVLGEVIPTVSEWGLIVLALLLLTAGTIVFFRKRGREDVVA